ncbi:MAG: ATP-binding cassette domain-containing protein [Gammaproteobacteria bacterium]|nr:ATP-binding cassette domain-containing protein [Gammaproteobacteria bacterium]
MSALDILSLNLSAPDGKVLCRDLSFRVAAGEVLTIMGPSGSGKSSILGWLTGTLAPGFHASGEMQLSGRILNDVPTEKRRLGLMLQQDYLFPHMSVAQNLKFGLHAGDRRSRDQRVLKSLESAGLTGLDKRHPTTLSGGQRSRVSLLRTLLADPLAVLLDEPFSRLDVTLREQIRQFTWQACEQLPVVLVSHDREDIPSGSTVIRLDANGEWQREN